MNTEDHETSKLVNVRVYRRRINKEVQEVSSTGPEKEGKEADHAPLDHVEVKKNGGSGFKEERKEGSPVEGHVEGRGKRRRIQSSRYNGFMIEFRGKRKSASSELNCASSGKKNNISERKNNILECRGAQASAYQDTNPLLSLLNGVKSEMTSSEQNITEAEQNTDESEQNTEASEQNTTKYEQNTDESEQSTAKSEQDVANSEQNTAESEQNVAKSEQNTDDLISFSSAVLKAISESAAPCDVESPAAKLSCHDDVFSFKCENEEGITGDDTTIAKEDALVKLNGPGKLKSRKKNHAMCAIFDNIWDSERSETEKLSTGNQKTVDLSDDTFTLPTLSSPPLLRDQVDPVTPSLRSTSSLQEQCRIRSKQITLQLRIHKTIRPVDRPTEHRKKRRRRVSRKKTRETDADDEHSEDEVKIRTRKKIKKRGRSVAASTEGPLQGTSLGDLWIQKIFYLRYLCRCNGLPVEGCKGLLISRLQQFILQTIRTSHISKPSGSRSQKVECRTSSRMSWVKLTANMKYRTDSASLTLKDTRTDTDI